MPVYDLLMTVRPKLAASALAEILRRAGATVLDGGGVLSDVRSYGERPLHAPIYRTGDKHVRAHMLQVSFVASPSTLHKLEHNARVDERVLRSQLFKRPDFPKFRPPVLLARYSEADGTLQSIDTQDPKVHAAQQAAAKAGR